MNEKLQEIQSDLDAVIKKLEEMSQVTLVIDALTIARSADEKLEVLLEPVTAPTEEVTTAEVPVAPETSETPVEPSETASEPVVETPEEPVSELEQAAME